MSKVWMIRSKVYSLYDRIDRGYPRLELIQGFYQEINTI
ncbi:Uncharacterised protein [Avibacterium paragallinarum]|uniref:Uncharacterized protein n=1 Tax=Avibacterium paragallinarum TaxID=728 RepID=A0A377IBW4_AVIPA|nr:Uncharacterised protein [Avibacterium paragallinarum]